MAVIRQHRSVGQIPFFSRGEVITADKLNMLADATRKVRDASRETQLVSITGGTIVREPFGTKVVFTGAGGRRSGGASSGNTSSEGKSYTVPFRVSWEIVGTGVYFHINGGRWHGNGGPFSRGAVNSTDEWYRREDYTVPEDETEESDSCSGSCSESESESESDSGARSGSCSDSDDAADDLPAFADDVYYVSDADYAVTVPTDGTSLSLFFAVYAHAENGCLSSAPEIRYWTISETPDAAEEREKLTEAGIPCSHPYDNIKIGLYNRQWLAVHIIFSCVFTVDEKDEGVYVADVIYPVVVH